jgi:protein-tyrosine-phosphatase
MALDRNINPFALANLLKHGKRINEQKAKQIKEQKAWLEHLAR